MFIAWLFYEICESLNSKKQFIMKKILLSLSLLIAGTAGAQTLLNYNFDGSTADLTAAGWVRTNQSASPNVNANWNVPGYTPAVYNSTTGAGNPFMDQAYTNGQTTPVPNGQAGGSNSFAVVNFNSTTSGTPATISNWLISPVVTVQNGDVVSFYTRTGQYSATGTSQFPDNLQLRMSTSAEFTTNPSTGPSDLGDFTNLLVEVNPTLNTTAYPTLWAQFTHTISGLTEPTAVKFAFRYFVTAGGPTGLNSNIIGIDTFSVDRTLATADFFAANFAVYPNPASNVLNIDSKNNIELNVLQLTDINGRIVKEVKASGISTQINISDLNAGVYFLKATAANGVGTTKFVKN